MPYKRLFILIEGDDDERFFEKIINPLLYEKYDSITLWKYSHETKKRINNFIRGIKNLFKIKNLCADYIFVTDINNNPCVSAIKEKILEKYHIIDDKDKISVVIKEIESWYLAGLKNVDAKKLTGRTFKNTDTTIKEQFDKLIPQKSSRINFMIEILSNFYDDIARKKNTSFKYFMEKYAKI